MEDLKDWKPDTEVLEVVNAEEQQRQFVRMILQEDLDLHDVWLEYFATSGSASEEEVMFYTVEMVMLPEVERDLLSLAAHTCAQGLDASSQKRFDDLRRELEDHGANRDQEPGTET